MRIGLVDRDDETKRSGTVRINSPVESGDPIGQWPQNEVPKLGAGIGEVSRAADEQAVGVVEPDPDLDTGVPLAEPSCQRIPGGVVARRVGAGRTRILASSPRTDQTSGDATG